MHRICVPTVRLTKISFFKVGGSYARVQKESGCAKVLAVLGLADGSSNRVVIFLGVSSVKEHADVVWVRA